MRKIIARDTRLEQAQATRREEHTGCDIVGSPTELLDCIELLCREYIGEVELDPVLEDGIRKLGRIRRRVGLVEELSRHSG